MGKPEIAHQKFSLSSSHRRGGACRSPPRTERGMILNVNAGDFPIKLLSRHFQVKWPLSSSRPRHQIHCRRKAFPHQNEKSNVTPDSLRRHWKFCAIRQKSCSKVSNKSLPHYNGLGSRRALPYLMSNSGAYFWRGNVVNLIRRPRKEVFLPCKSNLTVFLPLQCSMLVLFLRFDELNGVHKWHFLHVAETWKWKNPTNRRAELSEHEIFIQQSCAK